MDEHKHPRARDGKFTNADANRDDPGQVLDFNNSIAERTIGDVTYHVTAVVPGNGDVQHWEDVEVPTGRPLDIDEYERLTEAVDELREQADRTYWGQGKKLQYALDTAPEPEYRVETAEGVLEKFDTAYDAVNYLEKLTN